MINILINSFLNSILNLGPIFGIGLIFYLFRLVYWLIMHQQLIAYSKVTKNLPKTFRGYVGLFFIFFAVGFIVDFSFGLAGVNSGFRISDSLLFWLFLASVAICYSIYDIVKTAKGYKS